MENKRESNIELLRIISMILIVAFHCTIDIGLVHDNKIVSVILFATGIWGILGVNCFFIISFYFLYNSKFKTKKFIYIIKEILFYTIPLIIIAMINVRTNTGWSLKEINKIIFLQGIKQPFWQDMYWFATIYLLMYLSFPAINSIMRKMSQKQLKYIVILLSVIIVLYQMQTTLIEEYFFCVYMYITFFYIKEYKEEWIKKNCKIGFLVVTLVIFFTKIILECNNNSIFIINVITGKLGRTSLFFFIDAIFAFYIFKTMKIKQSKIINTIALPPL